MSTTIAPPLELPNIRATWLVWVARGATAAMLLYGILYPMFTAPSRFPISDADTYEVKLHGSPLHTNAIPLELPSGEKDLEDTLLVRARGNWHEQQVKLYRTAQSWDGVFIEVYVLQFLSVVWIIGGELSAVVRLAKWAAMVAILVTGIFDWMENLQIAAILARGKAPFGDLVQQVNIASETKWTAFAIACLLLSILVGQLPGASRALRTTLMIALLASGVVGAVGCFPGFHGLLTTSLLLYAIMPLGVFWHIAIQPAVQIADRRAQSLADKKAQPFIMIRRGAKGFREFASPVTSEPPEWSLQNLENVQATAGTQSDNSRENGQTQSNTQPEGEHRGG